MYQSSLKFYRREKWMKSTTKMPRGKLKVSRNDAEAKSAKILVFSIENMK